MTTTQRKGMGLGLGSGYRNLLPADSYVHALAAKGVKSKLYEVYPTARIVVRARSEQSARDKVLKYLASKDKINLDIPDGGITLSERDEDERYILAAKSVKSVNLARYSGKWYEQASIPTWFQRGCVRAEADYTPLPNGNIQVRNTCVGKNQKKTGITGTARSVSKTNRNLKVSFFPFIEGDYTIEYLDPRYQNAIVSSNGGKSYLWILSRKRKLPKKTLDVLKNIAKERGLNTAALKDAA